MKIKILIFTGLCVFSTIVGIMLGYVDSITNNYDNGIRRNAIRYSRDEVSITENNNIITDTASYHVISEVPEVLVYDTTTYRVYVRKFKDGGFVFEEYKSRGNTCTFDPTEVRIVEDVQ